MGQSGRRHHRPGHLRRPQNRARVPAEHRSPFKRGDGPSPAGAPKGPAPFAGHKTALEFRQNIEAPFFRYYLHGQGEKPDWKVTTFQSGSNTWRTYADWPPKQTKSTNLYFHADGTLS